MLTVAKNFARGAVYGAMDLVTARRGIPRSICGERILFPARWSRWYASCYEPETFQFLRAHCGPGDTVVDIGAHLGVFTVLMSRLVGPHGLVCSFEPTPATRQVLQDVVQLNGCTPQVRVFAQAVSDHQGRAIFYDAGTPLSNANSLTPARPGSAGHEVPTTCLDAFAEEHAFVFSCLKIDAEGAELAVLRGARKVFLTHRPAAALSLHPASFDNPADTLARIWDLLAEYHMDVSLLEGYGAADKHCAHLSREQFCGFREVFDVGVCPQQAHGLLETNGGAQ